MRSVLIETRDRTGVRIQEAFMVRTHPQWLRAREIVDEGRIGELKAIYGHFSYHLTDPANIRNVLGWGGGGLLDIGCYPITTSRFITGRSPAASRRSSSATPTSASTAWAPSSSTSRACRRSSPTPPSSPPARPCS